MLMFSHGLWHSSQELTRTSCFRLLLATAGAKVRRPYLYLLPAPLLITHHSSHRYQHSTPLPHSCVLRCRVEGLASCPKAAWVCCLRHVCTLPAPVHPASVLPAACCLPAPCVLPAPLVGSARGDHASSTRQLSHQGASRSRAYCRWRAAAPPAAAVLRRLRWPAALTVASHLRLVATLALLVALALAPGRGLSPDPLGSPPPLLLPPSSPTALYGPGV